MKQKVLPLINQCEILLEKYEGYLDLTYQLKYCKKLLESILNQNEINEKTINNLYSTIDYAKKHFYSLSAIADLKDFQTEIAKLYSKRSVK